MTAPARTSWPLRSEQIREQDLVPQKIEFVSYDDRSRPVHEDTFGPAGGLIRVHDDEYDAEGNKRKSSVLWTDFRGDRYYETTFTEGKRTVRLFDQDHRLITIADDVIPGDAPSGGWGEEKQGVAVNLAATPNPGRPVRIRAAL